MPWFHCKQIQIYINRKMNVLRKGFKTLSFKLFNFQQYLLLECLFRIENVLIFLNIFKIIFSFINIITVVTFLLLIVDKNQCVILSKSDKGDGDEKDEEEEERESKEQIEN